MKPEEWFEMPLISTIIERLNEKAKELHIISVKDKEWTPEFKKILKKIGNENGYNVWGTGLDLREWLFDVCWVKDGDKWITHFRDGL